MMILRNIQTNVSFVKSATKIGPMGDANYICQMSTKINHFLETIFTILLFLNLGKNTLVLQNAK